MIAFPSNQFGAQAPCSSECERAYLFHKIGLPPGSIPVFDKGDANGPGSLEPFIVAKGNTEGHDVAWNYGKRVTSPTFTKHSTASNPLYPFVRSNAEKFLADGDGRPVARFASDADPLEAEPQIRKLLGLHAT